MSSNRPFAIVTGASSGIGRATALALTSAGFEPLLVARNTERLRQVAEACGGAQTFVCDFADAAAVERLASDLISHCRSQQRPLKALINNAGIFTRTPFLQTSQDRWEEMIQVNLLAPVALTRSLFELFKEAGSAAIVNISSTLGQKPVAQTSAYAASKAALLNWTQALALEWAEAKIRVNAISPGLVDTPIHAFHPESDDSTAKQQAHKAQPLGRLGRPEDIAQAAVFLAQSSADWITGSLLTVDGGISLL